MVKSSPQPGPSCPITHTLAVVGGKWKPVIIFLVSNGIDRFGEMQRSIEGISKQMLTKQLRELEADGIIHRKVFAEVPPRVEYSVTEIGRTLFPVIHAMRKWGEERLSREA